MTDFLAHKLTRRSVVTSAVAGAALIPASSAVVAQDASQAASPESGEWTFTDDKGITVTLPSRPGRVVMDINVAAPLWDFGVKPAAIFGWNVMADGSLNDAGGNVDPEGIPTVGNVNEPIMLEELIAAEPDLIITITTALDNNPEDYWSIDPGLLEQVTAVAPLIAISTTGAANESSPSDAAKITERFAELAGLLGADLESDELSAAKADYDAAIEEFTSIVEQKSDLVSMFLAPGEDTHWVAWAPAWSDLSLYTELGMNIQDPETHDGWWEQISQEQALKYPTDLLFVSTRGSMTIEDLKASPTFGAHPAVMADQVFHWNQDTIHSYQGLTKELAYIAESLSGASKSV